LFGRTETLTDGSTVVADEAYIHESIEAPQAKIVRGFENQLMPAYSFTDEQIDDIVAYIKTLR
jgi:cytochrome c oxidase subunit 2